jgi:hypothetical protein
VNLTTDELIKILEQNDNQKIQLISAEHDDLSYKIHKISGEGQTLTVSILPVVSGKKETGVEL